jgi:pSer/pThr/pTyr-binding forkhead associated (FHA) protein
MDSGSRWVVGRGRSADLVAADPDMSRAHFEVVRGLDGAFRVRDLGSKNGLYVNGLRAKTATLRPGDELMAGGTVLRFER